MRDALEHWTGRFAGLFVVRPAHNPLGPLDFDGVYDERSDRIHTLAELVDRGYEDAYRQFIEPVVGGQRRPARSSPTLNWRRLPSQSASTSCRVESRMHA